MGRLWIAHGPLADSLQCTQIGAVVQVAMQIENCEWQIGAFLGRLAVFPALCAETTGTLHIGWTEVCTTMAWPRQHPRISNLTMTMSRRDMLPYLGSQR